MKTFEFVLLAITYTSLVIALFLQWLCYRRRIESIEAISFTISLLLLIVSVSLSPMMQDESATTIFTLICMVLVSSTTLFNTLSERIHTLNPNYKKIHFALSFVLIIAIIISSRSNLLDYLQYVIVVFLMISIVASMIIVRVTKPIKRYLHLEKSNRFFGLVFLALVPIYLAFQYGFEREYEKIPIGFLLYIAFTLLATNKIYDDLQRLSLINKNVTPQKQHFKNYGLTEREAEIATLLSRGITYQDISNQLYISLPTVKTHTSNIYKKCKVKTRNELTHLLSG